MPRVAAGQPVRIQTTVGVTDSFGVTTPTDPTGLSVQLKNTLTGAVTTYTYPADIGRDDTGKYHLDLLSLTAGFYQGLWISTGTAAGRKPFSINVVDGFTPSHISFDDVKARLNITAVEDYELEDMIASAVAEQEQRVGAVVPRQVVETVYAHYGRLSLSTRPVLSVASATVGGSSVDVSGWTVPSAMAGIVEPSTWWPVYGTPYTVTYTAGRNPVPQDLVEAALLRVQATYEPQRTPAGLPVGGVDEVASSTGYPLRLRAESMEAPYVLPSVA